MRKFDVNYLFLFVYNSLPSDAFSFIVHKHSTGRGAQRFVIPTISEKENNL